MSRFRRLLGLFTLVAGIITVSYLQSRFDRADIRKALAAVQFKYPDMNTVNPCRAEVVSRFKGRVRVICGGRGWLVDVVQGALEEEAP